MKDFLNSILSRKFLLTLGGAVALWSSRQYSEMVILLLGYIGVQGGADIVNRYKSRTLTADYIQNVVSHNDELDKVDTKTIVTGNTPLFDEKIEE